MDRTVSFICLFTLLALLCSCTSRKITPGLIQDTKDMALLEQPEEKPPSEGSLWSFYSRNSTLFRDHRSWKPGDILTVLINENSRASKTASTETSRATSLNGGVSGFMSPKIMDNIFGSTPNNLLGLDYSNSHNGRGTTQREGSFEAQVGVIVEKVFRGGTMYVEGKREVTVNDETQVIEVSGIVRVRDISRNNTILSSFMANASIKYYGKGVIADKQATGLLTKLLDWLNII